MSDYITYMILGGIFGGLSSIIMGYPSYFIFIGCFQGMLFIFLARRLFLKEGVRSEK